MIPSLNRRRLLAMAGLTAAGAAFGAEPPINTLKNSFFGGRTGVAINGYDTVAYFTDNKPVPGRDEFATDWKGAKWKFASQANLERFKADPEKYAPQYGGYCAYGVAQGQLVKVEPDQFTVRDGKLYLNYDAGVQKKWLEDPAGYIKTANGRFDELLKK